MLALAGARDWFDWSGWSVSVGGTLLSLLGLYITFREARAARQRAGEARTAADAARTAALDAVRAVSFRTTANDLASIRKDLAAVLAALESRRVEAALFSLRVCREALTRVREHLESMGNRSEIGRVLEDIGKLQRALEHAVYSGDPAPTLADVSETLSKHMDTMSRWSEQLRFDRLEVL